MRRMGYSPRSESRMSAPRPFIKRTDQTGEQQIERLQAELVILAAELAVVRRERDYLREQLAAAQSPCFATER